jgi:uncharacterized protein (TIGR00730 family)
VSVDELIEQFLAELATRSVQSSSQLAQFRRLLTRVAQLAEVGADVLGVAVATSALDELLEASAVFAPFVDRSKVTVFGSARTRPDNPLYEMARRLSEVMARKGWITVSGAGPGIMEASAQGAGRQHTLGVNIDLPFEQNAKLYIDTETMLVDMKYFFTRKVAMTSASRAFVIFPGGLGTMDETFEVLTLLHTGKTDPAPVVLVDTPAGTFWDKWMAFVEDAIVAEGYISAGDTCLVHHCRSVEDAVAEIDRFYSNYAAFEIVEGRGRLGVRHLPTSPQLAALAAVAPGFAGGEGFRVEQGNVVTFDFEGRNFVNLRLVIDEVNRWVP